MSVGYDPISQLKNVPKTPKQRYKIMTEEMPKNGKLSLEMMYQTAGTQINLDYSDEIDFTEKLSSNFRMTMMYKTYDRMDESKKTKIREDTEIFLKSIDY